MIMEAVTEKLVSFYDTARFMSLSMSMGWDYVSELRPPTGLLFIPQIIYEHGEPRWNAMDRGKPNNLEKNLTSNALFTTNFTWADPGANTGLHGERPATNCLSRRRFLLFPSSGLWWWHISIRRRENLKYHKKRRSFVFPQKQVTIQSCHWLRSPVAHTDLHKPATENNQ
jgi:hypothetical protein